jgi:hypothetical protein
MGAKEEDSLRNELNALRMKLTRLRGLYGLRAPGAVQEREHLLSELLGLPGPLTALVHAQGSAPADASAEQTIALPPGTTGIRVRAAADGAVEITFF